MKNTKELPVIFVRGLVVFPGMSVTVTVGREPSRLAVLDSQKSFDHFLVTMTQLRAEDPEIKYLDAVYKVGTICKIERAVALTDGGMQVQIEGLERFRAHSIQSHDGLMIVKGAVLPNTDRCSESDAAEMSEIISSYQPVNFDKIAWIERNDPDELKHINQRIAKRQQILEEPSAQARVRMLRVLAQES